MGYTNYWTRPEEFNHSKFEEFSNEVKGLINRTKEYFPVKGPYENIKTESQNEPLISEFEICINGVGEEGHETCYIPVFMSNNMKEFHTMNSTGYYSMFCKTARKKYDFVVKCILLLMKKHFPSCTISSDGEHEDWTWEFCQYYLDNPDLLFDGTNSKDFENEYTDDSTDYEYVICIHKDACMFFESK
jgi:hypothetical protein